jgi:predicted lactoylglutathione lyase
MLLTEDEHQAAAARLELGDTWSEAERMESLLVGSATHVQDVARRYHEAGVEEIIIQALPFDTELLERIDRDVLSAFA